MDLAPLVASIVCALLLSAGAGRAESQCGPFGDPPAEIGHGWVADSVSEHNPFCFGGKTLGPWRDAEGTERYACLYEPTAASKRNPLPLVVFLHGSIFTADSIKVTGLTSRVDKSDSAPGFILLAPEGRYTRHYYPAPNVTSLGWDNWYRQLSPSGNVTVSGTVYRENLDAAAIDHFVYEEIGTGKVDSNRIYLMGWSNGAAMALLYALDRPSVAAAAVYSAPNPFGAFDDPCPQTPVDREPLNKRQVQVFNPGVALMHVRNSCDIAGICPNAAGLADELRKLKVSLEDVILDWSGMPVKECDDSCGTDPMANGTIGFFGKFRGSMRHVLWPRSWTDRMLEFLERHPLHH